MQTDERELIRELANELAQSILNMLIEGGARTSSIGEPLDDEDSALGRACAHLGKPIPTVPSWSDELQQL